MKNNKGFTLVELLVAVLILGIITGMSIPLIRVVQVNNDQRKYNYYGDSLLKGAKLYVDSYGQDLFGYKKTGCAIITYEQLKEKGLINDFVDNNISCNNENTLVRVVKMNKEYGYSYQLYCGYKDENGQVQSVELKSSSTSKKVSEAMKHQEGSEEFDESVCNIETSMDITINPKKGLTPAESYSPSITLKSTTGINEGSSVQYAWIDADDKEGHTSIDYKNITNWQTIVFSVESKEKQTQKIISGTSSIIESKKKTLKTPSTAPAYYLLVLKVDNFRDLEGEYWKNKEDKNNPYVVAGVYNVGKKYTLTYNNNGGSGCDSLIVLKEKNVNTTWGNKGELCIPKKDNYTFNGWNTKQDGTGTTITKDTVVQSDLTVYATWRLNKVVFKVKIQSGDNLTPTTSADNGTVYKWGVNSDSYLTLSSNNGNITEYRTSINRGTSMTLDLPNYNNTKYINITKNGHHAVETSEWICDSGCKNNNQTFSHNRITIDNTDNICDSSKGDCIVTLKVNWVMNKPNQPTIINDKNNSWTNQNVRISASTTTPSEIIGKWYYKFGNGTYTEWTNSNGNTSVERTETTDRNDTLSIIVCNKNATGANDTNNCSSEATTIVKIDKTPPTLSYSNFRGMNGETHFVSSKSSCSGRICNLYFTYESIFLFLMDETCNDGNGSGCASISEDLIVWTHNGLTKNLCGSYPNNWVKRSSCEERVGYKNPPATYTKEYVKRSDNVGNISEIYQINVYFSKR